jgi:hypothetical protein
MSTFPEKITDIEIADPRWKELYRIGGISCLLLVGIVIFAVIAYFIWPYKPGFASTENVFSTLQNDRLGGLFSLDLVMLVTVPVTSLLYLALYVSLKRVNESYALIALVLALVAITLLIPTKPLSELVFLSERFATATTETEKSQYLAAGEALLTFSNGTAWMMYSILGNVSSLVSSLLMLRSDIFGKATAYLGIVLSIAGACIIFPVIGIPVGLLGTIASPIWFVLMARDFFRSERQLQPLPG